MYRGKGTVDHQQSQELHLATPSSHLCRLGIGQALHLQSQKFSLNPNCGLLLTGCSERIE